MPGLTTAKGYGHAHQKLRARIAAEMARGILHRCWRCGRVIHPGVPWDLGHDDHDRSIYRGPEHRRCNRATAGRRKRRVSFTSRRWGRR